MSAWWPQSNQTIAYAALGGGVGVICAVMGLVVSRNAPQARHQRGVVALINAGIALGVALLGLLAAALIAGQPHHVWHPIFIATFLDLGVFIAARPSVVARYRNAQTSPEVSS